MYRHSGNIAITFVRDSFKGNGTKALKVLGHAVCMVLFAVLLFYGCRYCAQLKKTATALPIKMKYIFTCVPIGMGISMLHALRLIVDELCTKEEK